MTMMKIDLLPEVLRRFEHTAEHGYIERRRGRSIVIYAADFDTGATMERVRRFAGIFRERYPRNPVVLIAKDAEEQARLTHAFPDDRIILQPLPVEDAFGRTIYRLRTQVLLFVGLPDADLARWLDQAGRTGATVAMMEGGKGGAWHQALAEDVDKILLKSVELFIVKSQGASEALKAAGVNDNALCTIDMMDGSLIQPYHALIDRMEPILSAKKRPQKYWVAKKPSAKRLKKIVAKGVMGRWLVDRNHRLIENLSDLKTELGSFDSLLCLGNGPSSEDPRLAEINYDRLFRVNHRWRKRGLLTKPDMVFTGNRSSVKAVGRHIVIGLQNIEAEHRLATALFPTLHRYAFATMERLGLYDFETFSTFKPTNGAVMLAAAVALAPKRLIIAGMDMFEHPDGSYPDKPEVPNAYPLTHDRDTELHYILSLLDSYDGELVILSQVLADYWHAHQEKSSRIVMAS